jgi:hypothetical protein
VICKDFANNECCFTVSTAAEKRNLNTSGFDVFSLRVQIVSLISKNNRNRFDYSFLNQNFSEFVKLERERER